MITAIFSVLTLVTILLGVLFRKEHDGVSFWMFCLTILFALGILMSVVAWYTESKENVQDYYQAKFDKQIIEVVLQSENDVDKAKLGEWISEYNNKVSELKTNYNREVYKDYYPQYLDWESLELIEWR